jgi:hypothetical protein
VILVYASKQHVATIQARLVPDADKDEDAEEEVDEVEDNEENEEEEEEEEASKTYLYCEYFTAKLLSICNSPPSPLLDTDCLGIFLF